MRSQIAFHRRRGRIHAMSDRKHTVMRRMRRRREGTHAIGDRVNPWAGPQRMPRSPYAAACTVIVCRSRSASSGFDVSDARKQDTRYRDLPPRNCSSVARLRRGTDRASHKQHAHRILPPHVVTEAAAPHQPNVALAIHSGAATQFVHLFGRQHHRTLHQIKA